MTVEVAQISNTNTFQYAFNRVNDLATAMTNKAVTTDSNTAVGNAAISGAFTADTLYSSSVWLSNVASVDSANITISTPNTVMVANGSYHLNANGSWNPIIIPVTNSVFQTSGVVAQEIDSYRMDNYGGAEFFIRVTNNNANGYQACKILSFHNFVSAFSTEYATMVSNNTLGTFAVTSNTTHVQLFITPTSSNTSIAISRVNF